jgi:hypothetical protein
MDRLGGGRRRAEGDLNRTSPCPARTASWPAQPLYVEAALPVFGKVDGLKGTFGWRSSHLPPVAPLGRLILF